MHGLRIVITSRDGEPCFAFHHVNAFEENQQVVVDLVASPDAGVIHPLYLSGLRSEEPVTATARLTHFHADLGGRGCLTRHVVTETPIELPRTDYRRSAGRRYGVAYGVGNHGSRDFIDKIVKVDVRTGETVSWFEDNRYPGEPVFVASADSQTEDQAVVLSVVLHTNTGRFFPLVLDAANLQEFARAEAPHHIPFGFHGDYPTTASGPASYRDLHR